MTALDNVSKTQFMPVSDLVNMHSSDALAERMYKDTYAVHGEHTRVSDVLPAKARHIDDSPEIYGHLDEPIKSGTIDPVLLHRLDSGEDEVLEGHHRIARARQLGVDRLPVSYDGYETQKHDVEWDDFYFSGGK